MWGWGGRSTGDVGSCRIVEFEISQLRAFWRLRNSLICLSTETIDFRSRTFRWLVGFVQLAAFPGLSDLDLLLCEIFEIRILRRPCVPGFALVESSSVLGHAGFCISGPAKTCRGFLDLRSSWIWGLVFLGFRACGLLSSGTTVRCFTTVPPPKVVGPPSVSLSRPMLVLVSMCFREF